MTPRSLGHVGFTLVRDYPVPVAAVWAAFAEEEQRRTWFGDSVDWTTGEWRFDFRVGGVDVAEGTFHDGPLSRYVATYTDIVEAERIVITYDMWLDGVHISTSIASFEFEEIDGGTRFTHGEHGIHLDGFDLDGALRERGTVGLLDRLETYLADRSARWVTYREGMSEKPSSTTLAANLYLVAAFGFLFAGVVFLITGTTAMWVSFFALGTVFIVLSTTERAKAAKAAADDEPRPDDPQG